MSDQLKAISVFNGKAGENAFVAELRWPKSKRMTLLLSFLLSGLPIGIAGGVIAYVITAASIGTFTSILIFFGLASIPIFGPISVGIIAAAISTVGVFVINNKNKGTAGPQSRVDIKSPIDVLGVYTAKIVFIPVVGIAICDSSMDDAEYNFISNKMGSWGYSNEYIEQTIQDYKNLGIDGIKKEIIQTRTTEGSSKYIKKETNLHELYKKAYNICDELKRKQMALTPEKEGFMDWLRVTLNIG